MSTIELIEKYAPKLRDYWLTLAPFEDQLDTISCGPQVDYGEDKDKQQYIMLDFSIWDDGAIICMRRWVIAASEEPDNYHYSVTYEDNDKVYLSSMHELWNYLRSRERRPDNFVSEAQRDFYIKPFNNNQSIINMN